MKQFITKVTVTGADDSTSIEALRQIAEDYPFVEFGILLSKSAIGRTRFPSAEWIQRLADDFYGLGYNLSGHLCGAWVRQFLKGNWPKWDLFEIHPHLLEIFQRWQINTHAEPHDINWRQLPYILREFEQAGKTIIFQCDGNNGEGIINRMLQEGISNLGIAGLFDLSHGAGILPEEWPKPIAGVNCGYAGGLSPENIAGQIEKIATIVGGRRIWIDAETKLRSPDDRIFDLGKVRAFLEAAKPWVIPAA